jgi:transcription elongation factor GreA-like protein/transcription elongation GreA/GreB family factor
MIDLKLLLQEEKGLGKNPYYSYKVSSLEDINSSILAMKKVETKESLRQDAISMEYENPDSIVLSFVAGRINLLLNPHEAQIRLNNLMNTFHDKRNYDCAEFIASTILMTAETPNPLRVLGEIAESRGNESDKWAYYERYVRCNSNDTDIIILVADNYEKNGDKKSARGFYQRALNRLLVTPDDNKIQDTFAKLLKNNTSDYSFYSTYLSKLGKTPLALNLAKLLLDYLYAEKAAFTPETTGLQKRKNIENIIDVIRTILSINSADEETRGKLQAVLKERYGKSSRYEECSKKFDVTKANTDPIRALDEFQKNIAYSKNTYVLQNATKKVGLITDVSPAGLLTVKFSSRPGDEVKINISNAMLSLTALPSGDIRAIKKGKKAEVIKEKIYSDGGFDWLLVTMLLSSPNKSSQIKDMKEELVPSVLSEKEWDNVSKQIKNLALGNPYIDIINKNTFHLRDYPSTREERIYETFIGYKDFSKRVVSIIEASEDMIDLKSDSFLEMVSYFSSYLKDERNTTATRIEALLVVEMMGEKDVPVQAELSFSELYSPLTLVEKKGVYENLSCKATKKAYIDLVSSTDKKAYDVLELIFPVNPTKELMKKMEAVNSKKFDDYMARALSDYKNNLIAYCFFVETGVTKADLKNCRISQDDFTLSLLNCLSFLYSSYSEDRQRKAVRDYLVTNGNLLSYLRTASEEQLKKLASHLVWNAGLTDREKEEYKALILSRFQSFDFGEKTEEEETPVEISVMRGFMCTKSSFEKKQAELIDIKEKQIPFTLHEIKVARELGDLRENSEYQYAKDHKVFLDREYEKLANELSSVKIMSMNDVLDGRVGFGTKVSFEDKKTGETKTFTFFGRWESDPDNGVIDINAPVGQCLINHSVGDEVEFNSGSVSTTYIIKSIEKVDF